MTDKQLEALRIASVFERFALDHAPSGWPAIQQRELTNAAITLRAQHAMIESMTVVMEGQHAAIERKDALLKQALRVINRCIPRNEDNADELAEAIKQELQ